MLIHPETLRALAKEHQRDLIADADAHRQLADARRRRNYRGKHAARRD